MTDGSVLLDRGDHWNSIPPAIQRRIEDGVETIRVQRSAIASNAKVRDMPPVSIDPAIWTPGGGGIVYAASGIWPSIHGGHEFGVVVAAGPAICRDHSLVRAILAHEFAHCFKIATRSIEHIDGGPAGALELTGDSMDETRENELLPLGADWFGETDAELIGWNDPRFKALDAELAALANQRHLPLTEPPPRMRGRVVVPPEWAAHIRALRLSRAR